MKNLPHLRGALGALLSLPLVHGAPAGEIVKIEAPLRDAGICAGSDGRWFLTGTTAFEKPGGGLDFPNNRGVRVWVSKDLKAWEDLGFVWDLWKDPSSNAHGKSGSAWQTELLPVPGLPPGERARGMTAPRLAHDGQRYWITYSMNGYAAGAMPGGADVKGPYKAEMLVAEAGAAPTDKSDAALFVDKDGTRYLLWGGGCIAKLKEPGALEHVAANEVGVEGPVHFLPAKIEGFPGEDGLPDRGAPYGPFLFHDGEEYRFVFTATTLREGGAHADSYLCSAPALLGPYSKPKPLLPDSGRVTAFRGPDGKWRLAWSGTDAKAPEFEKPVIAAFPPPEVKPFAAGAAKPAGGEIAVSVARPKPNERPKDVKQLLEMIEPLFEHPLRDGAICRGPDKTWFLVGTEAVKAGGAAGGGPGTRLDWSNNNGIRLWSSADGKAWKDCGYVWDIGRDAAKSPKSAWQLEGHLDLTIGGTPRIGRAITAPEIHFLKGTFWIVYSMNGSGIGLLKSASGKAEGPYEDLGKMVAHGRDGSLFEDGDGKVWLVWGQGFLAPMAEDMGALAGPARTLFTNVQWYPRYLRRPENMGLWGSRLVKAGDWYVWTFTTRTGRGGINAIDTMASWSKSLDGPWGEPCLMLANGGQSTLAPDGEGGFVATVSGEDEYSQCPFLPALTPVASSGGKGVSLRPFGPKDSTTDFQAVNSVKATALDLWVGHPDLIPCTLRDVCLVRDKDGQFYCTGSFWGVDEYRRDAVLFQSQDLLHWKPLPPVYGYAQLKEDGLIEDTAKFDELVAKDREGTERRAKIQIGEQKIWMLGGGYYMNVQGFCDPGGHFLLKSTSGKITGPYKGIQQIVGVADLMQDDDGAILFNGSGSVHRRFANLAEFEGTSRTGYLKIPQVTVENADPRWSNICFSEDCEAGIMKIEGRYVTWSTDWTGSYDAIYRTASGWKGPYEGAQRILPYGGNGRFFQDNEGGWWYAYFPNSNEYAKRAQNFCRMNMYPLWVGTEGGEFILEPKALRENRAALEAMGALWQGPRSAGGFVPR